MHCQLEQMLKLSISARFFRLARSDAGRPVLRSARGEKQENRLKSEKAKWA